MADEPRQYVESIAEIGYKRTCEQAIADNFRLRAAIGKHRERIMSLGHDGKGNHGTEWDRDLWSALYDFLRSDEMPDPTAITSSDLKTMVMQEDE